MSMKFCDHLSPATNNFSPPFPSTYCIINILAFFTPKLTTHASSLANTRTLEMVDVQLAWLILRALYYYYKNSMRKTRTNPS